MVGLTDRETIEMFTATAAYHGIDLYGADLDVAYAEAAEELRYPGHIPLDDFRPPDVYAPHNMALRALGVYAKRAGAVVPDDALCVRACGRLRIPGYSTCHWHGASTNPDDVLLSTMRAEIGVG